MQFDVVFTVDRMWRLTGVGQTAQVLQRLQDLETVALKQLDRVLLGSPEWDHIVLDEVDDVDWPGDGYSVVRQRGGMTQLELDESLRWGRRSAVVGRREDQYGCGEERAA